jgi:hypothetical protein
LRCGGGTRVPCGRETRSYDPVYVIHEGLLIAMEQVLSIPGLRTAAADLGRWIWRLGLRPWTLARAHGLNPWVFVSMACLGHAIEALVFVPWFRSDAWQLAFLVALRLVAVVVPLYIFVKGRGIAAAVNVSVAVLFVVNTAWHVCYFVYG